jgi:hypothetical protein
LLKYYYRPSEALLDDTKIKLEGNADTIRVVVQAESRDEAFEFARGIINMENWELDHSEE